MHVTWLLRWKGLSTGGSLGCSGVSHPCECCPLSPTDFTVPNPPSSITSCKRCKPYLEKYLTDGTTVNPNYVADLKCHHHDMHSDLNRSEREKELEEKLDAIFDLAKIRKETEEWYRGLEGFAIEEKCVGYTTHEIFGLWDRS